MLKKIVSWLNDCIDTRPRCMFDRRRVCSAERCVGYHQEVIEEKGDKEETVQRIIHIPYGIKDQQGNEVAGPCLRLAAKANLGNAYSVFNRKVITGIISGRIGK